MIASCNKGVADYLIRSGSAIRNWVEEEYVYVVTEIEKVLEAAFSKVLNLIFLVSRVCTQPH